MAMFDFVICDTAQPPHVKVILTARPDECVGLFFIVNGDVSQAEAFAEIFIEAIEENRAGG